MLVQKYGKQLIKELIDLMVISRRVEGESIRPLLIKNDIIKRSTKTVRAHFRRYEVRGTLPDGRWGATGDFTNNLNVVNGRNQTIFNIKFKDSELPQVMKVLRDEVSQDNE